MTERGGLSRVSAAGGAASHSSDGRLLFLREGTLMAQPFDAGRPELTSEAVPIAEHVGSSARLGFFSVSETGSLAYRTGPAPGAGPNLQLTWLDRQGEVVGTSGEPGQYAANVDNLALSPDATQVAAWTEGDLGTWRRPQPGTRISTEPLAKTGG